MTEEPGASSEGRFCWPRTLEGCFIVSDRKRRKGEPRVERGQGVKTERKENRNT